MEYTSSESSYEDVLSLPSQWDSESGAENLEEESYAKSDDHSLDEVIEQEFRRVSNSQSDCSDGYVDGPPRWQEASSNRRGEEPSVNNDRSDSAIDNRGYDDESKRRQEASHRRRGEAPSVGYHSDSESSGSYEDGGPGRREEVYPYRCGEDPSYFDPGPNEDESSASEYLVRSDFQEINELYDRYDDESKRRQEASHRGRGEDLSVDYHQSDSDSCGSYENGPRRGQEASYRRAEDPSYFDPGPDEDDSSVSESFVKSDFQINAEDHVRNAYSAGDHSEDSGSYDSYDDESKIMQQEPSPYMGRGKDLSVDYHSSGSYENGLGRREESSYRSGDEDSLYFDPGPDEEQYRSDSASSHGRYENGPGRAEQESSYRRGEYSSYSRIQPLVKNPPRHPQLYYAGGAENRKGREKEGRVKKREKEWNREERRRHI